jgi:hypothetical protein
MRLCRLPFVRASSKWNIYLVSHFTPHRFGIGFLEGGAFLTCSPGSRYIYMKIELHKIKETNQPTIDGTSQGAVVQGGSDKGGSTYTPTVRPGPVQLAHVAFSFSFSYFQFIFCVFQCTILFQNLNSFFRKPNFIVNNIFSNKNILKIYKYKQF